MVAKLISIHGADSFVSEAWLVANGRDVNERDVNERDVNWVLMNRVVMHRVRERQT